MEQVDSRLANGNKLPSTRANSSKALKPQTQPKKGTAEKPRTGCGC